MLERETELIKQTILESTTGSRSSIRLNEVMAAHLPRGVKSFIAAEVARVLDSGLKQTSRLSRITNNTAPTHSPGRAVLHALAMEYILERNEYVRLVEDAVQFLENYLCRPQWTLNQLLFENEPEITFRTMVQKFEYVVDYSYFGALLKRYARRKGWTILRSHQIKNLIGRIDEEVMRQHTPKQIALITQPIFDFLLFGNISMSRPIPVGALLLFYEDKKMSTVKDYVDRICHVRSRSQVSMDELIDIIEDLYSVQPSANEDVKNSQQEFFGSRGR